MRLEGKLSGAALPLRGGEVGPSIRRCTLVSVRGMSPRSFSQDSVCAFVVLSELSESLLRGTTGHHHSSWLTSSSSLLNHRLGLYPPFCPQRACNTDWFCLSGPQTVAPVSWAPPCVPSSPGLPRTLLGRFSLWELSAWANVCLPSTMPCQTKQQACRTPWGCVFLT